MADKKTIVLGAGVTGLAVTWKLAEAGRPVELVEISDQIGGASRTFKWGDFLVDTGPHKIYTQLTGILDSIRDLLKDELIEVPKQTSIYLQGSLLDYPFKLVKLLTGLSPLFGLRVGLSYAKAIVAERNRSEVSYEDWIVKRFGWGLYEAVFQSLANKIWLDPKLLSADLARRRIVTPGMMTLLKRIIFGQKDKQAPAPVFYYPRMGISRMNEKIRERIEKFGGTISLKQTVNKISVKNNRVVSAAVANGKDVRDVPLDSFVSTIPIAKMLEMLDPPPPPDVMEAARALKIKPIMLAFIEFKVPRLFKDVWIFFPDKKFLFSRISEQKGFSEEMGPKDRTVVCFDMTASHMPEAWNWPDQQVLQRCIDDLRACGLYHGEEVLKKELFKIPNIYPIYDLNYQKNLAKCLQFIHTIPNLYTIGRSGLFCYNNTDQCLDMGYRLAHHIRTGGGEVEFKKMMDYFDSYEIVD